MSSTQLERIDTNVNDSEPPPVSLLLRFTVPENARAVLDRVREVMRPVARAQLEGWLPDDEWRKRLPAWFLARFHHTPAQIHVDPLLWDFGSWLDAMKEPGWEWWSSRATEYEGWVRCFAHSSPYSIEPFEYLLRVAGAATIEFTEAES